MGTEMLKASPDPRSKYFSEEENGHYDARFFRGHLSAVERHSILIRLLAEFSRICEAFRIKPILMHGALIGWHSNRRLLPWDDDIDLCLFHSDLFHLDSFPQESLPFDRSEYLLDVNPNHVHRETMNCHPRDWAEPNRIDGRFIHRGSGAFIDLTVLSVVQENLFRTKCPHTFYSDDLFPLDFSEIEGVPIYVPHAVERILVAEYGEKVIGQTEYGDYRFDSATGVWVKKG